MAGGDKGKELEAQGRTLAETSRTNVTMSNEEKLDAGRESAKRLMKGRMLQNMADRQTTDKNN